MPSAVYITLARSFNWTPEQIDACDAQTIDNILTYLRAASDQDAKDKKIEDLKQRLKNKSSKRG